MSNFQEHENESVTPSMSISNHTTDTNQDTPTADVDDEGINDIVQSVNTFRQMYNHPSALDSQSDSASEISEFTSSSVFTDYNDMPSGYLLKRDDNHAGADPDDNDRLDEALRPRSMNSDDMGRDKHVYYEEIYVDPIRDIDIAPILRFCCGWSPCCCCLYNKKFTGNDEDDDEFVEYDDSYYSEDFSTVRSARSTRIPLPRSEIPETNPYPVNKNALGLLLLNMFYHLASAMWTGTVFSIYLFQILPGNSNTGVGIVEGVKIISRLLVSIFFHAKINDKGKEEEGDEGAFNWTRPTMTKIGGVITLIAAISQTSFLIFISQTYKPDSNSKHQSLYESDEYHMILQGFIIISILWGIQSGITLNRNGPVITLFRDSIYEELKQDYLTFYHILSVLSSTVGAMLSIIMFIFLRTRDWNVDDLTSIMYFGMVIEVFAGFSMFFQKLKWTNGEETPTPPPNPMQTIVRNPYETVETIRRRRRWVPRLLNIHYVLFNTGSGMILPFFPLFFDLQCGLSPISIQTIFALLPLLNEVFSQILYSVYTNFHLSDLETFVLAKAQGVLFLFLIILSQLFTFFKKEAFWIACMFILRTVCVNSSSYVEEKIYSEATSLTARPADARLTNQKQKQWSTRFEAVKIVSYSLGAVIGGIFADIFGGRYGPMFLIAAVSQTLALLIIVAMFPLVPKTKAEWPIQHHQQQQQQQQAEESDDEIFTHHDESLEQLLL